METSTTTEIASSRPMGWTARVGLAARGLVYVLMGWLAVLVAMGERARVDQRGVLTEVISQPFGGALVLALAIGFAAYALWRLSEVVVGVTGERDGVGPRAISLIRAIAYGALSVMALSVFLGARGSQSSDQEQLAAGLMTSTAGRWLVALAGAGLLVAGAYMVYQGITTAFLRYFETLPPRLRTTVIWLGRVGTTSRGVVFAVSGVLALVAAWRVDPEQAGGLDDAIRAIQDLPGGSILILGIGVGLILFGVYGLAEARWRQVPDGDPP